MKEQLLIRVFGYHATTKEAAQQILDTGTFRLSANDYDWLGDGVYFWQDAPVRAWAWGREEKKPVAHGADTTVIGALLEFPQDQCIDLLDVGWAETIRNRFAFLLSQLPTIERAAARSIRQLPDKRGRPSRRHTLDRLVLNRITKSPYADQPILAVRAAFQEGGPLFADPDWGTSALHDRTHVQIAVRDPAVIRRIWLEDPI